MANQKVQEIDLSDEKLVMKKVAEEQDAIAKLEKELAERQERKKKINSKIRSITHKTKMMEEVMVENAVELDKQKSIKNKNMPLVNRKEINQKIDKLCEEIFKESIKEVDPQNIEIEVEFGHNRTIFQISDNVDVLSDGESVSGDKTGQLMFRPKTFKEMKDNVAPFFSLSPSTFFFADGEGFIYLDNLPVRKTLLPLGHKTARTIPLLKIVLIKNFKYDEVITEKINEEARDSQPRQTGVEPKESLEMEQARKKAEERRAQSEAYHKSKDKRNKIKGIITSILYIALVAAWLFNLFSSFEFHESVAMRNSVAFTFQDTFDNPNTTLFYEELRTKIFSNSAEGLNSTFANLNYVWPYAKIILTRYQPVQCQVTNQYMSTFYTSEGVRCIDPHSEDRNPFQVEGIAYNYINDKSQRVLLPITNGDFDNIGYNLDIDFADPDMDRKIELFTNNYATKIASFNFIVLNPSLAKMACIFRVAHHYNNDAITTDQIIYIFNFQQANKSVVISGDIILALASVLLLLCILDFFELVPTEKADLDLELLLREMKKKKSWKKEDDDEEYFSKRFWAVKLKKYILKIYPPSFICFLNLASISLIVAVASLNITQNNHISDIKLDSTPDSICPDLISRDFTLTIISAILIMIMMVVLLTYISQFVPFLSGFILIFRTLAKNVDKLGVLVIWLFLSLALFGIYTSGPFFPYLESFNYYYTAILLLIMSKAKMSEGDIENFQDMKDNIGSYAFVVLIIFTYVVLTFLILKITTAIVIKTMKEAEEKVKTQKKKSKTLQEKSLNLIKTKLFEEYKMSLKKSNSKKDNTLNS